MTDCQIAFGRPSRQLQVRVTVDSVAARDWVATIAHSQAIGIDLRITSVWMIICWLRPRRWCLQGDRCDRQELPNP